jgi:superfamily I DNA and RNA helicase
VEDTWWRTIDDLIGEQRDVIGLPLDGSFFILGPPGSGKTNLLLLRANYITLSGYPNISIVVFNRTLREFIRAGGPHYDFDPNNVVLVDSFLARSWTRQEFE